MCRLFALSSRDPVSPMRAIEALNVMKEGHDGSGVGLFLRDMGGPFGAMKDAPILSGIFHGFRAQAPGHLHGRKGIFRQVHPRPGPQDQDSRRYARYAAPTWPGPTTSRPP